MDDPFDDPGPLEAIKWEDLEYSLVLITPMEKRDNVPTPDGRDFREVIYGRVVVLDGPQAPKEYAYTPIFPRYLQGQVRSNIGTGRSNLGRVGRDPTRQRPGQSAPWVLGAPSDTDKQLARDHLARAAAPDYAPNAPTPGPASRPPPTPSAGQTPTAEPPF